MEAKNLAICAFVAILGVNIIVDKLKAKRIRSKRRYSIRPLNRNRKQLGNFAALFQVMKSIDPEQFFIYTRMSRDMFDHLLQLVGPHLQKRKTMYTISAEQRLCITLHYLSEGCSMQEMAFNFQIGKATVHSIIKETTEVLWNVLTPQYLSWPTKNDLQNITTSFFNRWNMPNCCGAIDGKHVAIQSPKYSGTDYFNYHSSFSMVLMASCDAFYKFTCVDIGCPGSNHDSNVFRESGFGESILNETLEFPDDRKLPRTEVSMPIFFVADQAFPLHTRIMRPFPGQNLGEKKNIFNYRLSRARRMIENTFGILVQRWHIFRKTIIADTEMCENIIKAAVVLHNYVQKSESDIPEEHRRYCPTGYVDYEDDDGGIIPGAWRKDGVVLKSIGRLGSNNSAVKVKKMRDVLADYFVAPVGLLPWQENYVHRGGLPNLE